jgi:hypothetical protein
MGSPFLGHGGGLRVEPNFERTKKAKTNNLSTSLQPDSHHPSEATNHAPQPPRSHSPQSTHPESPPPRDSAAAGKEATRARMTVFKGFAGLLCACALFPKIEVALAVPGLWSSCFRFEAGLKQASVVSG